MFSVKIFNKKENRNKEFSNTINNIVSFIFEKLNFQSPKVISDSSCIEIVSGSEIPDNNKGVTIELLIRKHIVINNEDFNDRAVLDRHISEIKHFCEQAKNIEDLKYLPINMRN
jgi:hypothetical protein